MDYYRFLCPPLKNCVSSDYAGHLLECAYFPQTASDGHNPHRYGSYQSAEESHNALFFSGEKLQSFFANEEVISDIMKCECDGCSKQRKTAGAFDRQQYKTTILKSSWLLMCMLIYLGKLHVLYYWLRKSHRKPDDPKFTAEDTPEDLFRSPHERDLFRNAFIQAQGMFLPIQFELEHGMIPLFHHYDSFRRFPLILDNEWSAKQGTSGEVQKFHVPREYVHESVRNKLHASPVYRSFRADQDQYHFVRKVQKSSSSAANKSIESAILRIVGLQQDIAENIITLIAFYQWRDSIYFVFPFVEGNLNRVLRHGWMPEGPSRVPKECLPLHWLWHQVCMVCKALDAIHCGLQSPLDGDQKIIVFHLDLKPDNILVTHQGALKITDFGYSYIGLLEDGGENTGSYYGGDFVYRAPESMPSQEALLEAERVAISGADLPDHKVRRNYDVWQMACIMTEVLVFIYEGGDACAKLDEIRATELPPKPYYAAERRSVRLKNGIKEKLETFYEKPEDESTTKYRTDMVELIFRMFETNPRDRIYSEEVVRSLDMALSTYHASRQPRDNIYDKMKITRDDSEGFSEIGWIQQDTVKSLLEIDSVEIEHKINFPNSKWEIKIPKTSCRIQLYRKVERSRTGMEVSYRLKVGYTEREGIQISRILILASKSYLNPLYLFEDESKGFGCRIGMLNNSGRDFEHIINFNFRTLDDLKGFQGAVLNQTRILEERNAVAKVLKTPSQMSKRSEEMKGRIIIQFWHEMTAPEIAYGATKTTIAPPRRPQRRMALFENQKGFIILTFQKESFKRVHTDLKVVEAKPSTGNFYMMKQSYKASNVDIGSPTISLSPKQFRVDQNEKNTDWALKMSSVEITFKDEDGYKILQHHEMPFK